MKEDVRSRFEDEYDAVVVGAGMGGLMAGVNMAQAGKKTLVLEQHNLPGGFATTFVRGDYEFEATIHEIADVDEPGGEHAYLRRVMDRLGIKYDLCRVPEAYVLIVPEEDINVVVPFGVEEFIKCIVEEVPGTETEVRRYVELCCEIYEAMNYLVEAEQGGKRYKILLLPKKFPRFHKYLHRTVKEVETEFDLPPKVLSILYGYWCYQGPSLDLLGFPLWAYMLGSYLKTGAYIPRHHSHDLSAAIAERICELGGQVAYNCRVEKIHVDHRRVVGVELSDGTFIRTGCVLANAHQELVYGKMVCPSREVPRYYAKKTNAEVNSNSVYAVYLGLDATPEELGIKYYEYFISDTMDTRVIHDSMYTDAPRPFLSAICLDVAIPGSTGEGKCQLTIARPVMGDVFEAVSPLEYEELKTRACQEMIDMFEETTGAHIREHIEEVETVSPVTWNRYAAAFKGQVFGYEQNPWNSSLMRLIASEVTRFTGIRGLHFVGGASETTHGYLPTIRLTENVIHRALRDM